MKPLIMILTLSIYSTAVSAEQADDKDIQQQSIDRYLNELSNLQPLPPPVVEQEPHFLKLIVPIAKDRGVRTIKAELNIRESSEKTA
jgi:hypothetical protein